MVPPLHNCTSVTDKMTSFNAHTFTPLALLLTLVTDSDTIKFTRGEYLFSHFPQLGLVGVLCGDSVPPFSLCLRAVYI